MTKNGWIQTAALALCVGCVSIPAGAAGGSDAEFAEGAKVVAAAAARGIQAQEAIEQNPVDHSILRDQTTVVRAALNSSTVKCSAADYSGPMLKVLVPALAELTVLNHRNTREGAPCVAAGRCGAVNPKDILQSGEGVDRIPVRVVLKKVATIEGEVCHVALVETVTTVIRGVTFFHERRQDVADRAADDCR